MQVIHERVDFPLLVTEIGSLTSPENEEALRYVEERLRVLGVIRALEAQGFEPGDDVEIAGVVFELDPGMPFQR